jgi:hypothetical protein
MWVSVRSISGFSAWDAANFFKLHGMLTSDEVLDQVRFSLNLIELNLWHNLYSARRRKACLIIQQHTGSIGPSQEAECRM